MSQLFGAGIRFLEDQQMQWARAGLRAYLRVKNFNDAGQEYVELGFQFSPSGNQITGFDDIEILPPPEVREVSLHNIGLNNTRLHFGARYFIVSHSFVLKRMEELVYTDPYQVWRDPLLVGIIYNSRLFSIESVTHEEVAGETISWALICNAQETEATVT